MRARPRAKYRRNPFLNLLLKSFCLRSNIKHSTQCLITRWNTWNFFKNTPLRVVFSTLFSVFHHRLRKKGRTRQVIRSEKRSRPCLKNGGERRQMLCERFLTQSEKFKKYSGHYDKMLTDSILFTWWLIDWLIYCLSPNTEHFRPL